MQRCAACNGSWEGTHFFIMFQFRYLYIVFFFFFLKILIYWVLISLVQFIIDFFNTVYIGDMFGV